MTDLLEKKKTKYDAVDMAQLEKGPRDEVYAKAGKRTLPLLFISGKFIGVLFLGGWFFFDVIQDYEEVQTMEEEERLDAVLHG